MATQRCTRCREKVQAGASTCRYCGYEFTGVEQAAGNRARLAQNLGNGMLGTAFLLLLGWCVTQPPATPAQKKQAAELVGIREVAADPVNVDLTDDYIEASTRSLCADRYPADFSMRAACGRNARRGAADFSRMWNANSSNRPFIDALSLCFARYTENGSTDFAMIGACARNQAEGYKQSF